MRDRNRVCERIPRHGPGHHGGEFHIQIRMTGHLDDGSDGLSGEATIDRLLDAVAAFRGDAPQSDDMTCVVVRVEGA